MRDDVARVKREVSLLALLPRGSNPRKNGRARWLCRCPFHEDDAPSFSVSLVDWGWCFRCFACGVKGDVIQYVQLRDRCSFRDALAVLQAREAAPPPVVLWPSRGALVVPCDARGCDERLAIEARDVPHLGQGLHNHWGFIRRPDGTIGYALCAKCQRRTPAPEPQLEEARAA